MSAQNNIRANTLILLAVVLLVIVAVQSFFLFRMYNRMGEITGTEPAKSNNSSDRGLFSPPTGLDSLLDDDWLHAPFESNSWNPFDEMERMQERMNRMFSNAFGRFDRSPRFRHLYHEPAFFPNLDLEEEDGRYVIRIDLPGADKATIDVQVDDQVLRIRGKREELIEKEDRKGRIVRRERRMGHFDRSIELPEPVDAERMETKYEEGIFTIILPKVF